MLIGILKEMRNASEPISLQYLSRKLALDETTTAGMVELLVQKGLLREEGAFGDGIKKCCESQHCKGCSDTCCSSRNMPRVYSLVNH